MYQEEEDSAISHMGVTFRLNPLLRIAADLPTDYIHVSEMRWILSQGRRQGLDPERIARSDLRTPLLLLRFGGKMFVLDGIHRLAKGVDECRYMLPGKVLSVTDLRTEFQVSPQPQYDRSE